MPVIVVLDAATSKKKKKKNKKEKREKIGKRYICYTSVVKVD